MNKSSLLNNRLIVYKGFEGNIARQIPKLIAEGRTILSVADFMKRRLEVLSVHPAIKKEWWNYSYVTGDAVAYHPDGRIKFVLDAHPLRSINPNSKLLGGALVLRDEEYRKLRGLEYKVDGYHNYTGTVPYYFTEKEVNRDSVWKFLARDAGLLKDVSSSVFNEIKKERGEERGMVIKIHDYYSLSKPVLLPLSVSYIFFWCGNEDDEITGYDNTIVGKIPVEKAPIDKSLDPPPLEKILKIAKKYSPKVNHEDLIDEMRELYLY